MKVCSNGHNANAVSHLAKVHKVDSNGNSLLAKSTITVAGTAATPGGTVAAAFGKASASAADWGIGRTAGLPTMLS